MRLFRETTGTWASLAPPLSAGGEGEVRPVAGEPGLLAKVVFAASATPDRAAKVSVLTRWPDRDPRVAFPVERLLDGPGGAFRGFLMPAFHGAVGLFELTNPAARRSRGITLTASRRVRLAADLADLAAHLHAARLVLGDLLNPSNVLAAVASGRPTGVRAVDADTVQVTARDAAGRLTTFRCGVGLRNFLAPELVGRDLATLDRTPASDAYALAVLLWQLLKDGHPFAATGAREPVDRRMRAGLWPWDHTRVLPAGWAPVDDGLPFARLPAGVRELFARTFVAGHAAPPRRPTPAEWHAELSAWRASGGDGRRPFRWVRPAVRRVATGTRRVFGHPTVRRFAGPVAAAAVFVALALARLDEPPPVVAPPSAVSRLPAQVRGDEIPNAPALWRAALPEVARGQAER
jgi:DNA-binding helix-hairpin-helix protein with protein kinase domain